MLALYKRELRSYFQNLTGSFLLFALLAAVGIFTSVYHLYLGYTSFGYALSGAEGILLFLLPLLTMRIFAEERRRKTDLLLYSLPVSDKAIVLAKFFAALTLLFLPFLLFSLYPILLSALGRISIASSYTALFGFFLLSATLLSISLFFASLTDSELLSATLSFGALALIYLLPTLTAMLPSGRFITLLSSFALFLRFSDFADHIFDLSTLVFELSVILFFLHLTVRSVEQKHRKGGR